MAHAGTMVGGSAQTKQNGSPWPAIALTLAVVVATIAGVWLASSAGLVGGAAKPAADRSYDSIEAQRGVILATGDRSFDAIETQRGVSPTSGLTYLIDKPLRIVGSKSTMVSDGQYNVSRSPFSTTSGTFQLRIVGSKSTIVGESQYNVSRMPFSTTAGTFHPGKDADDRLIAPVTRDRVGGP